MVIGLQGDKGFQSEFCSLLAAYQDVLVVNGGFILNAPNHYQNLSSITKRLTGYCDVVLVAFSPRYIPGVKLELVNLKSGGIYHQDAFLCKQDDYLAPQKVMDHLGLDYLAF